MKPPIFHILLALALINTGCASSARRLDEPTSMDQYSANEDRYKQERTEDKQTTLITEAIVKAALLVTVPIWIPAIAVCGCAVAVSDCVDDVKSRLKTSDVGR